MKVQIKLRFCVRIPLIDQIVSRNKLQVFKRRSQSFILSLRRQTFYETENDVQTA